LRRTRANTLSPDDQYQLALANALVNRPHLLILDEPLHGAGTALPRSWCSCWGA
jgi:ABC-type branched-subunit amino acid transport system ATPase component